MYLYLSFYTRQQRNSNGHLHVFGLENLVALFVMLHLETGSEKFKIAAAKPDVPVSHLLYKTAKKFQRLSARFRGRASQWRYREDSVSKPEVINSRWRQFIDISAFTMHAI
jgi:hypothetical protein